MKLILIIYGIVLFMISTISLKLTLILILILLLFSFFLKLFKKEKEIGQGEFGAVRSKIKKIIYNNQQGMCGYGSCTESDYLQIHHILPKSMGGDNRISNLIYLCPNHHSKAHDNGNGPAYNTIPNYLKTVN